MNAGCGKTTKPKGRDLLTEQRQQIADREAQRHADEQAAALARMDAEIGDYVPPTKYAPKPDPRPAMSAREVASARERRAAAEAEQRFLDAPRLEAERQGTEDWMAAETKKRELEERQRAYWRDWVLEDRDPKFHVSPAMVSASMSVEAASAHNVAAVEQFISETPEYATSYKTEANSEAITGYLSRNGVNIFDLETLKSAFIRLRDLGVLTAKPATAEVQTSELQPSAAEVKKEALSGPKFYRGRDYATGLERDYSSREVERMSSTEYRRAFEIVPTVSELFTRMAG